MKALWIRSDLQTVEEVDYTGLLDMQRMVGGLVQPAYEFHNRDIVFVDKEGMLKRYPTFFIIRGGCQPYCGNGLLVGRNRRTPGLTFDPRTTRNELVGTIRFCTAADILHAHGHA